MLQTSKWQIQVGRNKHIVSGKELEQIINAGEARFVKFRDLVINPAFMMDAIMIENNIPKLESPDLSDLSTDEWIEKIQEKN